MINNNTVEAVENTTKKNIWDEEDFFDSGETAFGKFLNSVVAKNFSISKTSRGDRIISQSARNELRREGIAALKKDLTRLYSADFDVVETKEGLVIVAENPAFTFSWELKSTIKSIDWDPFLQADNFDAERAIKARKAANKTAAKK